MGGGSPPIYIQYIYILDSSHEGIDGINVVSQSSRQSVAAASRGRSMQPIEASSRAIRSRQPVGVSSSRGSLKSSQNRCQEGSGALGRSQVHSSSAKIAPKSSSGLPRNAFRAARDAPRAPRGGPTELPERPGAVQSESERGLAAFRRAKVGFFGICVLVYTGA